MKKKARRMTKREAHQRAKSMLATAHILIAVVALVECFLLISFTTYSWIESASSLVIENGENVSTVIEHHYSSTGVTYLDIASALKYELNLDNAADKESETFSDLDEYYRDISNFRMAKSTSPDGLNFYFPLLNDADEPSNSVVFFRKGDTTDYNTSYSYFDFAIVNRYRGRNFYFASDGAYNDVFSVNAPTTSVTAVVNTVEVTKTLQDTFTYSYDDDGDPGTPNATENVKYEDAILSAMRMSITTQSGNDSAETHIYSKNGEEYVSMDPTAGLYSNDNVNYTVSASNVRKISDHHYGSGASESVFLAPKDSTTKVSIRVWLEVMDPRFQQAFGYGLSSVPDALQQALLDLIPGVDIGVHFKLENSSNSLNNVYFDDYTFSAKAGNDGGNLTNDYSTDAHTYIVYFKVPNPDFVPAGEEPEFLYYPMHTVAATGYTRWNTGMVKEDIINYIKGADGGTYSGSCFVYGYMDGGTLHEMYRWDLTAAPTTSFAHYYTAYGKTPVGSTSTYSCAGLWNTTSGSSFTPNVALIKFKDQATAVTTYAFNENPGNYQFMNANHTNTVYVNSASDAYANATTTATMYYDNQEFKAYVPKTWLTSGSSLNYTYAAEGYLTANSQCIKWTSSINSSLAASIAGGATPIYTAVGYGGNVAPTSCSTSASVLTGVGTYGSVREIKFTNEFIDTSVATNGAYRYFAGVSGVGGVAEGLTYYAMKPDVTRQCYSAYVPTEMIDGAAMEFRSYNAACSEAAENINGQWYATSPSVNDSVYYAVTMASTADSSENYSSLIPGSSARGAWHIAVLVDGTYENLIYDTILDLDRTDSDDPCTGAKLEYSIDDGEHYNTVALYNGSEFTDHNRLTGDNYRWYALFADDVTTVKWRWTPYNTTGGYLATEFVYTQTVANGIYCVVYE